MVFFNIWKAILFLLIIYLSKADTTTTVDLQLIPLEKGTSFKLKVKDGTVKLQGKLGQGKSNSVVLTSRDGSCVEFASYGETANDELEDCIELGHAHWYGGPEQYNQYWPLDQSVFSDYSYVSKSQDSQAVAEPYWLSSLGVYIHVKAGTSLFIDMNSKATNTLCLISKSELPYPTSVVPKLEYSVCSFDNAREAHENAIETKLGKPSGYPDERMIRHPIWSTWARYKKNINETIVLNFADEILFYGFDNSQLEIDDDWEICYGSLTFREDKFPDPKRLTDALKDKGFRVTLWVHPFVNLFCGQWFLDAVENHYLVFNATDNNTLTSWWDGIGGIIDFTNPDATEWYISRLNTLKEESGIDAYKFDAGETSWLPQPPKLNALDTEVPGIYTYNYVNAVSQFGGMIEVRSAERSQSLPIFVRMLDKDSRWSWSNGIKTLVTTLLQMNMVGYPLVLPDMIGGNGYGETPSKELFIRWLQANVFMPSLQYSFVPWDYDIETIQICKQYTELHAQYADKIIELAQKATQDGTPINPPIWWIDPLDQTAQIINDEYLLGEDILVAPVLEEGATSRDIYLPSGQWHDELRSETLTGPIWLVDYSAELHELPYFTRIPSFKSNFSVLTA